MRYLWGIAVALCLWLSSAGAQARVVRFAVLVGNDQGSSGDAALRYAERDARRVGETLAELGGVEPANAVLLAGQDAETLRRTLITVNDRIRSALSEPNTQVVLIVYYSGHADAESLHMAGTQMQTAELAQLVRGSAASFRLLVLDACRSGQLVRKKGGKIRAPFPLENDERLQSEGLAFLTASAAEEDAQESDELGASFFTHALLSGMLGAADMDDDGSISLEEAYRYAYDTTLRTTSRTAAGTQHPTFRYDFRGQGNLVLTTTRLSQAPRGVLRVQPNTDALMFRAGPHGSAVAEVTPSRKVRSLSLLPGSYFVRVRGDEYLLEGSVQVTAGAATELDSARLARVEYAQLVRKGTGEHRPVQGLELLGRVRAVLPNAETPCVGAALGYRLDLENAVIGARAGVCLSRFDNELLEARVSELDLALRVGHAWDLSWLTLELGLSVGAAMVQQTFETEGKAPDRRSVAGYGSAYLLLLRELPRGLYLGLEGEGQLYVLSLLEDHQVSLRAAFAPRGALLLGKHF